MHPLCCCMEHASPKAGNAPNESQKNSLTGRHKNQKTHIKRKSNNIVVQSTKPLLYTESQECIKPKMLPVFQSQEYYSFAVVEGNNSQLVRKCLENRTESWREVAYFTSVFHFKWQPTSRGVKFDQLSTAHKQLVNHFEFHHEITTKDCLCRNLLAYAELNKFNVFDYIPLTFMLDSDSSTYGSDLEKFTHCYASIHSVNASTPQDITNRDQQVLQQINKKLHRISFSKERRVVSHCRARLAHSHFAGKNIWILKPTGFNRGRGVSVFDSIDKLRALLKTYSQDLFVETGNRSKKGNTEIEQGINTDLGEVYNIRSFVIQKYIERPMLIHDRKFDVRVWVLVAQNLRVYFFREGYLRTSSEIFTLESGAIGNKDVHLTNNAIQKFSENYGKYEDGNQMSFPQFQKYLCTTFPKHSWDVGRELVPQMKKLVAMSMAAVRKKLNNENRSYCMEILGYDFVIDEDFRPWLIEVNTNPCLEESSRLLQSVLPRMIDDALKLTVDVLFPRKRPLKEPEIFHPLSGYSNEENLWDFLCQIGPKCSVLAK